MSENPLLEILERASASTTTSETMSILKQAQTTLRSFPQDSPQVQFRVLLQIKKLSQNTNYQLIKFIAKFYQRVCQKIPKNDGNLLIQLANDIYNFSGSIQGTQMAQTLQQSISELLTNLIQNKNLQDTQQDSIRELIKKQTIDFKSIIKPVVELLSKNDPNGMVKLVDVFSNMKSLKDQYYYYTQLNPVIRALQSTSDRQIMFKLMKFLNNMIFQINFNIKVNGFDQQGSPYAHHYTLLESRIISYYSQVYFMSLNIIQILLNSDLLITQNLIYTLQRLWNLFPKLTEHLQEYIVLMMKEIAANSTQEHKDSSARFLYRIMNSDNTFKFRLEAEPGLEELFQSEEYSEQALTLYEAEQAVDFPSLNPTAGFPISAMIDAGGTFTQIIEIPEPNCILAWGFAVEHYDINFSLSRVDLPEIQVIQQESRHNCSELPVTGMRLLQSPGLYKFEWNNLHSWFRSKHLRFRICILKPYRSSFVPIRGVQSQVIKIVSADQLGDNCYVNNFQDILQIGAHIQNSKLSLICGQKMIQLQTNTQDQINLAIAGFVQQETLHKKFSAVKIGIIEKTPVHRPELDSLGAVAISRDVQALGLHAQLATHSYTLISIVCQQGVRSSVILRGKILLSDKGISLGDISNLKNQDLSVGVSTLLTVFGPALVVLSGSQTPPLGQIVENVRKVVDAKILKKSTIKINPFTVAETASKLHFLHYKYKFAFSQLNQLKQTCTAFLKNMTHWAISEAAKLILSLCLGCLSSICYIQIKTVPEGFCKSLYVPNTHQDFTVFSS